MSLLRILQPGPTAGGAIGKGLGEGISAGLQMLMQDKINKMQSQKRAEALEAVGIPGNLAALDPAILREFAKTTAQQQAIQNLFGGRAPGVPQEEVTEEVITERGPAGLKSMSDEQLQIMQGFPAFKDIAKSELDIRSAGKKESARTEEGRYKSNLPLYQEDQKKVTSLENETLNIDRLEALNNTGKLPKGLGRLLNVNFKEGELRIPFVANPETQAFVKTINDFTVKAKDSFGARVTNFELQRFMKRLPGLLNSQEGRSLILNQMKIMNEINQLNKEGIITAFEAAGGLRKIDYDQAQRKGKQINKQKINELKKQYLTLEKEGAKDVKAAKKTTKAAIPSGNVEVISPDGQRGYIPKAQLKEALKAGYKRGS